MFALKVGIWQLALILVVVVIFMVLARIIVYTALIKANSRFIYFKFVNNEPMAIIVLLSNYSWDKLSIDTNFV